MRNNSFVINDGIQPRVFPSYLRDLMRPAEVQRLERVRHQGLVYRVFPSSTQTRKVHSVGVAWQALQMLKSASVHSCIDLAPYERTVVAAALYHDLGHPAFSHTLQRLHEWLSEFTHEQMSARLIVGDASLHDFYDRLPAWILSGAERRTMLALVDSTPRVPQTILQVGGEPELAAQMVDKDRRSRRADAIGKNLFLSQIISGLFDADRFDYVQRDPLATGVRESVFDPSYLMSSLGIVENNGNYCLALEERGLESLIKLLSTRAEMHTDVYTHHAVLKFEGMMYEGAKRALFSLGDRVRDYAPFVPLMDDTEFERFICTNTQDETGIRLFLSGLKDRESKYAIAWGVRSYEVPSANGPNEKSVVLEKLLSAEGEFPEDTVRRGILERVNAGNGPKLESHEVIAYFRNPRTARSREKLLSSFDLTVFNPSTGEVYNASDRLRDGGLHDQRLVDAFNAFARPIDSYYFLVLCPAQHRERVKKAAEEYVQDLLKEK